LVLAFALILGLVTAYLVYSYINRVQQQTQQAIQQAQQQAAQSQVKIETAPVVVAVKDIPQRTLITPDMVEVKQIPVQAKHPQAMSDTKDVVGKVTKLPVSAGEQVISAKFAAQRAESGLSYVIPPNKRAVSIEVSEIIGSGGLILPGDMVDVIAVFDAQKKGKDMATYILQDVEVLAVGQVIEGEAIPQQTTQEQVAQAVSQPVAQVQPGVTPTPTVKKDEPPVQPKARSVTLAVSPEEAQRLVLAEETGKLRLALRPARERTQVDLPEATLSTISHPLQPATAIITGVEISPTNAKAGDTLTVKVTVKNVSTDIIRTQDPKPEYVYVQGQTYNSQNFPSETGKLRVGLNMDGPVPVPFPYRWGLGADLPPGASTTVTGYVKLTYDMKATNFWAGLIQEPATVIQDNVGTTTVTVVPTNMAVVAVEVANVRSGPNIDSSVVARVPYGTALPIIKQEADWYRVKLEDGREGYVAAGWIMAPGQSGGQ